MHPSSHKPGDILVSAQEIARIVSRLGGQISADYADKNPVLVSLLKGGVVFLADLIRQLPIAHHIDFMRASSYEGGTVSKGNVRIIEDLKSDISGRNVIIVEDVIDTGKTLAYIVDMLSLRAPESVEICSLLRKESARNEGIQVKYLGKTVPDEFVVGYGLDYDENFRYLPHIAKLVIQKEL